MDFCGGGRTQRGVWLAAGERSERLCRRELERATNCIAYDYVRRSYYMSPFYLSSIYSNDRILFHLHSNSLSCLVPDLNLFCTYPCLN